METWQSFLAVFGGNAVLLAVLGWSCKALFEKLLARDSKVFEAELKAKTDKEIERLKSELGRSLESYKIQLKKSEFFFEREYAAALEFTSVSRSINPRPSYPNMDWHDAMQEVIDSFRAAEKSLEKFLLTHGTALTENERTLLLSAISLANDGDLHGTAAGDPQGHQIAESLCKKVSELEVALTKRVRSQSSL